MQCVLNRLLYVIFDKLPHINANFDFLPEPGGMENISIKQIMLEEQTWSTGMFTEKGDVFTKVVCIFSGWPFYIQIERNMLKIICGEQLSLFWNSMQENACEGCFFTYSEKRTKVFSSFSMSLFSKFISLVSFVASFHLDHRQKLNKESKGLRDDHKCYLMWSSCEFPVDKNQSEQGKSSLNLLTSV